MIMIITVPVLFGKNINFPEDYFKYLVLLFT